MRYRVHSDLNLGGGKIIPRGSISNLAQLRADVRTVLLKQGSISPVSSPPLSALGSAWAARREKLARADIVDVDGLMEADPIALAKRLHVAADIIRIWQTEAEAVLKI